MTTGPVIVGVGDAAGAADAAEHLDLLVRGSSARGPVRATVLGTVTEALLRHAACSVMILPRPDLSSASAPGPSTAACRTR